MRCPHLALLVATIFIAAPNPAHGEDMQPAETPAASLWPKRAAAMQPKRDEPARDVPALDVHDEVAALDAIRVALSQIPDGSAYVWHRRHGRMSGIVQPTVSFKDTAGRVCRHIVVTMTAGDLVANAEGIACRVADGSWQLDG